MEPVCPFTCNPIISARSMYIINAVVTFPFFFVCVCEIETYLTLLWEKKN